MRSRAFLPFRAFTPVHASEPVRMSTPGHASEPFCVFTTLHALSPAHAFTAFRVSGPARGGVSVLVRALLVGPASADAVARVGVLGPIGAFVPALVSAPLLVFVLGPRAHPTAPP
ncbi:hypothetical protein GCM10022221_78960 [Actinocorallia aurea]